MMAAVLLMQPVACLVVAAITLLVLLPSQTSLTIFADWYTVTVVLDKMWRIVVGLGGFLALATLSFQVGIQSESAGYILDAVEPREVDNLLDATNNDSSPPAPLSNARHLFSNLRNRHFLLVTSAFAFTLMRVLGVWGSTIIAV